MKIRSFPSLLLTALIAFPSFAQDIKGFDQSFLESLPAEIKSDLIQSNINNQELEQKQYRRPSTYIKKPTTSSARFGANIFSMMQTTMMPINDPNFDGSYVLDFGDVLEVQLIGQESSLTKLPIKRDGSISLKDIGKIYLAGLSLQNASDLIKKNINSTYIGVESLISLINVRDIQIIVSGNASNPGPYLLNGNSNIFHALMVSGGPSEGGSYRSIDLIRNNKKIKTVDLYNTFIYGRSDFDERLRSGDIIFINPAKSLVTSAGAFNRNSTYELRPDEYLSKILELSNGLNKFADLNNIYLERILDGEIKSIKIQNVAQLDSINSKDGDTIFIRNYSFRTVSISGAILNPGNYLMNEGDDIFDVINKSGGFTKNAYPFGGIYENKTALEINTNSKDILYNAFLKDILSLSQNTSDNSSLQPIIALTERLKESNATGMMIIR